MSDALNLLRKAILAGRGGAISYDASSKTLSLEGASLPADTQVYKSVGNKWYSLLAVWLQWQHQKLSFTDLRQKGAAMGLGLMDTVTITDKAALLSYLSGADAGAGAGGGVGDAGGGGGGGLGAAIASAATAWSSEKHGSAMFGDDGCSPAQLEAMLRAETQLPGRTRATVLQAPGMVRGGGGWGGVEGAGWGGVMWRALEGVVGRRRSTWQLRRRRPQCEAAGGV